MIPFFVGKLIVTNKQESDYQNMMNSPEMRIFAYLRLLRITQLPKILNASEVYAHILMQKFPTKRQAIHNVKQIFSLILFLLLSLHLSACFNIY